MKRQGSRVKGFKGPKERVLGFVGAWVHGVEAAGQRLHLYCLNVLLPLTPWTPGPVNPCGVLC